MNFKTLLNLTFITTLSASDCGIAESSHAEVQPDSSIEWALNVGGGYYMGADGIAYQADTEISSGVLLPSAPSAIKGSIKGAQDSTVFQTLRVGTTTISQPIENGYYDLIFKFAEPENIGVGKRIFNVIAENQTVIPKLDVIHARDGNAKSSLVRMANNIKVSDGVLDVKLEPLVGKPILNALVVRKKISNRKRFVNH